MLRIAVVGAGIMGSNHARVASRHAAVELVAVVDADRERADRAAATSGAKVFGSVAELLDTDRPDAAVVAVPTAHHASVAMQLIEAGVHVLVEKPIAATVAEGEALVAAAERAGVTLMVGHVERFNAAVIELARAEEPPVHVEASRIGPYAARVADSVIADLMIHDLDIVRALARSEVVKVSAVAQSRRTERADIGVALLTFASGTTATLTASRLGQQKIRELRVTYDESFVVADLLHQDVSVTRVSHTEFLSEHGTRYRQTGMVEIPFLDRQEPLAAELAEFARAIGSGSSPLVTGADGIAALRLVEAVEAAAR